MFQSILVPLDGSEFGERALPLASRLARASSAPIRLVHVHVPHMRDGVVSNTPYAWEGAAMEEYDRKGAEEESLYLTQVADRIRPDTGTDVSTSLLEGEIANALDRYAQEGDAGLVVMSTHGRTGVKRAWLGSRADELIHQTHLPLFLVPPEHQGAPTPSEVSHLLVSLDGTEFGEQILEPAIDLARVTGARMTLVHVVSNKSAGGSRFPTLNLSERRSRAQDYLDQVANRARGDVAEVDTLVVIDDKPAQGILHAAEDVGADCIALATHGYKHIKRAILGSVADQVLRESERPILLKRPA